MQVIYFLNDPMVNFLFYCHFILYYIERKWFLRINLATILPLISKLFWKFQRLIATDGNIEMLKNSWISKNFIETFVYKAQTVSRLKEIIQPSTDKRFLHLWNKNFLWEIYRNVQMFALQVLQEVALPFRYCAAQMFFWRQPEICLLQNFKSKYSFGWCCEYIFYNVGWVKAPKTIKVFWSKMYCKVGDLFCSFLLVLRLSPR